MNSPARSLAAVDFPRHFAWLAGACMLTLGMQFTRLAAVGFSFYGALHALTLVVALRRPISPWRALSFIGLAAVLSDLNFHAALALRSLVMTALGADGLYLLVAAAAAVGGLAYAALGPLVWLPPLRGPEAGMIAVLCASAGLLAALTARHVPLPGSWWLATLWWFAFSAAIALARPISLRCLRGY